MAEQKLLDTSRMMVWSDDPKPDAEDAACMAAARVLALAINTCDVGPMRAVLARDAVFGSQSVAGLFVGKRAVLAYFRDTFEAIRDSGRYPIAEIGRIDGKHRNEPGVIVFQAGALRTFWSPRVDAEGKVEDIFGYTVAPPPWAARGTGERPGFDEESWRQREEPLFGALRRAFAAAEGPIMFRGFALTARMASERLQPVLDRLTAMFPGSGSSISMHDWNDHSRREVILQEGDRYDVSRFPAIAVEKGGTVFRGASEGGFRFDEVAAFVMLLGDSTQDVTPAGIQGRIAAVDEDQRAAGSDRAAESGHGTGRNVR
ncbi:hypothetical protein [Vineibacter terrae]|uniref:hypothetical protein n=1 Tax=Vineibacter terrae TaxID=2586908 RepID=UPI002E3230D8|nr:hypothetical protein [Vineibacter terrae]HEX2890835.1 hypothetical protein [Vineibacter terrae]